MYYLLVLLIVTVLRAQTINIGSLPDIEVAHVVPLIELFDQGENERLLQTVTTETEVFVRLSESVNFDELGIFDEEDFLCSDIFEFLQGEENDREEFEFRSNCRICPEGDSTDTQFFTLILPELLPKDILRIDTTDPFFFPGFPRLLQEQFNINLTKFIRVVNTEAVVELFELPDFDLISVQELDSFSLVLLFSAPVQFIRGISTTDTITVRCIDIFESSLFDSQNCTLAFDENRVLVSPTNFDLSPIEGDEIFIAPSVRFPSDNPSFFSASEVFGLRQISREVFSIDLRPRVFDVIYANSNEIIINFDFRSTLAPITVERIRCNQIFDVELTTNSSFLLFNDRTDVFCSLNILNESQQAIVLFTDIIPFIPASSRFILTESATSLIVDNDGIGIAGNTLIGDILIGNDGGLYNISVVAIGPSILSLCDTEIFIEIAVDDTSDLMLLDFDLDTRQSIIRVGEEEQRPIPDDFCEFVFTTVVCDISKVNLTDVENVVFELVFSANLVALRSDDSFNLNDFASTNRLIITQDRTASKIPISIAGVDLSQPQFVDRGSPFTFTAVLGDVFGCAGADQTSLVEFVWSISDNVQETVTGNGKLFFIAGDELPVGDYTVSLTASSPNLSTVENNTLSFDLTVNPVAVVVISESGESQTVSSEEENLILDALRSCNPNVVNFECQTGLGFINRAEIENLDVEDQLERLGFPINEFSVEWSCQDCGDNLTDTEVFAGVNRSSPIVEIPLENLGGNEAASFTFSFSVTNLNENNIEQIDVNVDIIVPPEQCIFPGVSVSPVDLRVNADQSVTLSGNIQVPEGSEEETFLFKWVENTDAAQNVFADTEDPALVRRVLFIPSNTLSEGARYDFTFSSFTSPCLLENDVFPEASLGFNVNRRPFGGVLNVNPTVGTAFDTFLLTTANWVDEEFDLPLTFAFELIYVDVTEDLNAIEEFSDRDTTPLSQFTQSLTLATNLQVPPAGKRTVLIAVAKDSLGAVSRRLITNANVDVVVENPFVNDGVIEVEQIDVTIILGLIEDLQNTGDATLIPNLCSSVNSALNELSQEDIDTAIEQGLLVENDLLDIRKTCFDAVVQDVLNDPNVQVDSDVVNLVASSISTITENVDQIDAELLADADAQTQLLVEEMERQVEAALRGEEDPSVASIIPESFRQNIADTVSNILGASELLFRDNQFVNIPGKAGKRRRLQDDVDICDVLGAARTSVNDIGNLQTSVLSAGAPQVDADANNVQFAALRESINDVGGLSNFIDIPDAQNGNNAITLPTNFAEELKRLNQGVDEDLNILAVKWDILIRCEERIIEEVDCSEVYEYDGPRNGREGTIVSLDFLPLETGNGALIVDEISEPIIIIIDLPPTLDDLFAEGSDIREECDAITGELSTEGRTVESVFDQELVCGFFDEAGTDFITSFCEQPPEIVEVDGVQKVQCRCFHATDYTAWQAFRYDVRVTLIGQPVLSELAIIVLFVFAPIILILCLILLYWARYKDKKDANNILKGALARIKLMRIMKNRQKRQFFDNVKIANVETMMKVHDLNLNQGHNSVRQLEKARNIHRSFLFRQFFLAVKYEHSLFGLSRYDPNFSRVQRVMIFISVIISNFGAAALIFELRNESYQFSVAFVVGVSFLAAFLVSIPLKLVGRALFKTTENKSGSKEDQVNSMYKIITRMETADGVESEKDQSLVEAIHDLHVAEKRIKKARSLERQNTYSSAYIADRASSSDLEDDIPVAVYLEKKKSLQEATLSARGAWKEAKLNKELSGKFYSSWSRIKSMRSQSNSFLKVASLISGEPKRHALPRESRLPRCTLFVNYIFVTLVVCFYIFYIIAFVGTRQERAENGFPENENLDIVPLTEQEYIVQWAIGGLGGILVSYLVAEPLIALLRYVILPYIILTCGKKKVPDDFDEDIPVEWAKEQSSKKNIREGYAHIGFDLAADLFENLL